MAARLLPAQSLHAAGRRCLRAGAGLRRGDSGARDRRTGLAPCRAGARRRINGDSAPSEGGVAFTPAKTEEEWLQLDAKVNKYPSVRTFKAIGVGGAEFVDSMVDAVQRATNQAIDRRSQVSERPSKQGSYLAVSIRKVTVTSGIQVLGVFREMKQSGGDQLKYLI